MKIAIQTPFEGFVNDIADVVRLFYGEGAAVSMLDISTLPQRQVAKSIPIL